MNVLLITSDHLRHMYLAQQISDAGLLKALVIEKKSSRVENDPDWTIEERSIMELHFRQRAETELKYFGSTTNLTDVPQLKLENGQVNEPEVVQWILSSKPDLILVFGSSILKGELLKEFAGRIINLHLGLSPYYKGSATNLWPLFFREPECVGATIHMVNEKVDAGAILHQLRPEINERDSLHDIGNKIIVKASAELPGLLKAFYTGIVRAKEQTGEGRVFRVKDLKPFHIKFINENLSQILAEFLADAQDRFHARPIISHQLINFSA
jgi:folate-dependent phosphoribosylglycinamide formyltransferase PurN